MKFPVQHIRYLDGLRGGAAVIIVGWAYGSYLLFELLFIAPRPGYPQKMGAVYAAST